MNNWYLIFVFILECLQVIVIPVGCDLASDLDNFQLNSTLPVNSRKRRYVVFPEGSTLSVAACVSPTALTEAGAIFTSGVAWALSYDLPNETIHLKNSKNTFPISIGRQKRDLYVRFEKLIDSTGFNGKSCVLKTICETVKFLSPRQGIIEEIFRVIFTYSPKGTMINDHVGRYYRKAHQAGEADENCDNLFACPISFLKMGLAFGKYT